MNVDFSRARVEFRATETRDGKHAVRRLIYTLNAHDFPELSSNIITARGLPSQDKAESEARRQANEYARWGKNVWGETPVVYGD